MRLGAWLKRTALAAIAVVIIAIPMQSVFADPQRIYIAPDDHTDYMWSGDEAGYQQAFLDMLDYYLNLADQTASNAPPYQSRFNTDGTFWVWTYLQNRTPDQYTRLVNRIRSGHIGVPMNTLVSTYGAQPAEAVLRGMYYAGRLERQHGLRLPLVEAMENQTLPFGLGALWAGAGARYSWRGVCACYTTIFDLSDREHEIYRWVGQDGSSLIMKWDSLFVDNKGLGGYAEARDPVGAINFVDTNPSFISKYPYGVIGAFGEGWDDLETLNSNFVTTAPAQSNAARQVIISNEVDYFQDFAALYGPSLPNVSLSFGNEWDIYSASMPELSASVKRSVEKLRSAEALATLVALQDPSFLASRAGARDTAFMDLGLYWEHNWNTGGNLPSSARGIWQRKIAAGITSYVDALQTDAASALGGMIANPSANQRFYVFNALSWARTDIADLPYSGAQPVHVVEAAASGTEVASQIVTVDGQQLLRVLAANVPAVGYKVYEVRAGAGASFPAAASVGTATIENAAYRVALGANGVITSVIDKRRSNREFVRSIAGLSANDLGLGPGTATFTVENAGPVSVTLKASASAPLALDTRVTLSAADRVDIRNDINQNFSGVRTWAYGFNVDAPVTHHEEVGAVVTAALAANGGVYSARNSRLDWLTLNHFADLTTGAGDAGVSLSSPDLSFMRLGTSNGMQLDTVTPQLSVLAGGQIDGSPSGIPNQGDDTHFMQRFALRTHGAYDEVAAMRFSLEHQNPLVTGVVTGGSAYPADTYSLLSISDPNVVLWALKPAEEGIDLGVIVRLWNLGGASSNFSITPAAKVQAVGAELDTHLETPLAAAGLNGNNLLGSANAHQMVTYRLVRNQAPALSVLPSALAFAGVLGGANPAPSTLSVSNTGTGTLSFTATTDAPWLAVTPANGTAPQPLQVSASIAGLTAGTYTGHVTISAAGATGSPSVVSVTLTVGAQGSPILSASLASLGFSATAGGADPTPASVSVINAGSGTLSFSASTDVPWLTVTPTSGTAPQSVQVAVSLATLSTAGTYTGHVTITSAGAAGSPASISVTLTLAPSQGSNPGGVLLGDQTIETSNDENPAGSAEAFVTTASASGTLSALVVYVDTSSSATKLTVGLYADSAGHPGALLTQGTLIAPLAGQWNTVPVPNVPVSSGSSYWIAVLGPAGAGTLRFRDTASGGATESSAQIDLTALPASWTTGSTFANAPISAYGVAASAPVLSLLPTTIAFNATAGGANPAPSSVSVSNTGAGTLSFSAASDATAWLTVTPASGSAPQSLQVSASIAGLTAGTYTGHITVTATGASGSPGVITVTLTLNPQPRPHLSGQVNGLNGLKSACVNLVTRQKLAAQVVGSQWDCTGAGFSANVGDTVNILLQGVLNGQLDANGGLLLNGNIKAMGNQKIACYNLTTRGKVAARVDSAGNWNCRVGGFSLTAGDQINVLVEGLSN